MRIKALNKKTICSLIIMFIASASNCLADTKPHPSAIQSNNFAKALVKLSKHLIKQQNVISQKSFGGYGGITNDLKFYTETKTINQNNKKIISIIQWERKNPNNLHHIAVNIYDHQGRIKRDYSASYLPVNRRAPYQTLINLHYYEKNLYGFRQFDALNNINYEQCSGSYNNMPIDIEFNYYEIPETANDIQDKDLKQAYLLCFKNAQISAAPYTTPLIEIK